VTDTPKLDDLAPRSFADFVNDALAKGVRIDVIIQASRVASHRVPYGKVPQPGEWEMAAAAEIVERVGRSSLGIEHGRFLRRLEIYE
jgi:hypothetical protein